jgi:pyroglutamyl-peptidase
MSAGPYLLNVRALTPELRKSDPDADQNPTSLELRVLDADGMELGQRVWRHAQFTDELTYQNISLAFGVYTAGPVTLEVSWTGQEPVRLDYLEVFRGQRRVLIDPPSGVPGQRSWSSFHLSATPAGSEVRVSCDGKDQSARLAELLKSGQAERRATEFDLSVGAATLDLLAGCTLPSRVKVAMAADGWVHATSRVTYYEEKAPCAFSPEKNKVRVLLTGFEPFPANSEGDNSSELAVQGFDASALPHVSIMKLTLPVEWDTAAEMIADVIDRCRPHSVISFGQGRSTVELETTAYNAKDTSDVCGGVPDNRGVIVDGEPIVSDGPATLATRLPVDAILAALGDAGVTGARSTDPGRYICNNIFYATMSTVQQLPVVAGFVHLPTLWKVDADDRQMLQKVVTAVVKEAAAAVLAAQASAD